MSSTKYCISQSRPVRFQKPDRSKHPKYFEFAAKTKSYIITKFSKLNKKKFNSNTKPYRFQKPVRFKHAKLIGFASNTEPDIIN